MILFESVSMRIKLSHDELTYVEKWKSEKNDGFVEISCTVVWSPGRFQFKI